MQSENIPERSPSPIAFSAVAVLVIGCVGAAIFLIPSESDLLERLTTDGKIERIREIVEQKIGHEPSSHELVGQGVNILANDGWDESDTRAMNLLAAGIDDVGESFVTFSAIGTALPDEPAEAIFSELADRALGANRPKLAAEILQHLSERSGFTEERSIKIVDSLRANSAPGDALAALRRYREAAGGVLPDHLTDLFDKLAMEAGESDAFLESAIARFERSRSSSCRQRRAAIDKLITAAISAGRSAEVVPACEEFLAGTSAGQLDWRQIIGEREKNPQFDDEDFREIASETATLYRWNNQPDKAFDLYRKLAALDDSGAIQQCLELHLPLLRESEMVELLDAFIPIEDHPEYTLLAAQIHAKRTDYETADKLYREHLAANPDDAAIWAELGGMWDACSRLELALEAYRHGSAANPGDDRLRKRIARTIVSLGHYEEALDYYREMERFDRKDLTQYLTLATNLGDHTATNDALRKWFTLPGERRAIDYLRLARSYGALGQYDNMIAVYRRGVSAFPEQRDIKLELAGELSRLHRHSDVMQVLRRSGLSSDPEALSLYLSAALASKQYGAGLAFSGGNAESRLDLPISAKLPLAEIYFQTGSASKSDRLYRSIPQSELPTLTRATLAFRRGQFSEAESLLHRHLAAHRRDHRTWSFLASVYQAQRKKPQAQEAYQQALDLLKLDMRKR